MDIKQRGIELGEQHWSYIEQVLKIHGEDESVIEKIGFHYKQAMKHGFKHGIAESGKW